MAGGTHACALGCLIHVQGSLLTFQIHLPTDLIKTFINLSTLKCQRPMLVMSRRSFSALYFLKDIMLLNQGSLCSSQTDHRTRCFTT